MRFEREGYRTDFWRLFIRIGIPTVHVRPAPVRKVAHLERDQLGHPRVLHEQLGDIEDGTVPQQALAALLVRPPRIRRLVPLSWAKIAAASTWDPP